MRRDRRATATAVLSSGQSLVDTLIRVAWLAVLLGLTMDALLIVIAASFGEAEGRPMLAGVVQNVAWSVLVCVGVAVGLAASRARPQAMGIAGLLAAPMAFHVSRSLHKGALQTLAVAPATAGGLSPLALGLLKGVEYACLGAALGLISLRPWGGALAYAAAGLGTGILFGGTILALHEWAAREPIPADVVVSRAVNEVLFPVGCSLVIFAAQALGKRVAA